MSHRIVCPRCQKAGLVRVEHVVCGSLAESAHYCGYCEHTWTTPTTFGAATPPKHRLDAMHSHQTALAAKAAFDAAHEDGLMRLQRRDYKGVGDAIRREGEAIRAFRLATRRRIKAL